MTRKILFFSTMFMSSLKIVVDGCSGCLKLSGWFSMCFIVYSIPSSCGMFVYREVTSIEASIQAFAFTYYMCFIKSIYLLYTALASSDCTC